MAISRMICVGWGVVGSGITRAFNVTSIARTGVGTYNITLTNAADYADGMVIPHASGAFKADAVFTDTTHIVLTTLSLSTGSAADVPNGTRITLLAFQ